MNNVKFSIAARALMVGVVAALVLVGTAGHVQAVSPSYDFIAQL